MIVGIVGGGQLARMMALAGIPLGLRFRVLEPAPDACAAVAAEHLAAPYDDADALERLADGVEVVTFDFENVPAAAAERLAAHVPVYPPPAALATAQDRMAEKSLFTALGIPTAPYVAVGGPDDLQAAVARLGLPAVLKTRRLGYDGKGQRVLRDPADAHSAWAALGSAPLILEGFVPFARELSILAVRSRDGDIAFYPLTENRHRAGILELSRAPCAGAALERLEQEHATRVLESLDYVGVLAIEFFESDGTLLANEMAPRVHNSGHWTIEGAETSQFENHLRAVLGLPLGDVQARGYAAMVNFIGALPARDAFLRLPGSHFHDYGKAPRVGRKVGHGTLRADTRAGLEVALAQWFGDPA